MLVVVGIVLAAGLVSGLIYVRQERLGLEGAGIAALRTAALSALTLLILNPSCARKAADGPPVVLLDRSLSMGVAGGHWGAALDSARAIAGLHGTILGFGTTTGPLTDTIPSDGSSRIREALAEAQAMARPIAIVTDGELTDADRLQRSVMRDVEIVLVPRDVVPGAALVGVSMPLRVQRRDSIRIDVAVDLWGERTAEEIALEILSGNRHLLTRTLDVPAAPSSSRRRIVLPPGMLAVGEHILDLRLIASGDREPRDNVRRRLITVTEEATAVVIVDPADWEGRFLARVLEDVGGGPVQAYARVRSDSWLDMRSLEEIVQTRVLTAVREAGVVVVRGSDQVVRSSGRRGRVWSFPAIDTSGPAALLGDWYVMQDIPGSPLAADLARIEWDSLAPLLAIQSLDLNDGDWVALTAHRNRRGVPRPVLVGSGTGRTRALHTLGVGFWRWSLRGGAGLEATRSLLAAGLDWILDSDWAGDVGIRLVTGAVVPRGAPLTFEWDLDSLPDSAVVRMSGEVTERDYPVVLDAERRAYLVLDPGVYRWEVVGTGRGGTAIVEEYSDEFSPRVSVEMASADSDGVGVEEQVVLRRRWWLFLLVLTTFGAEWAWRQRRGLP